MLRINKTLKILNLSGTFPLFVGYLLFSSFNDNKIGNEGVKLIAKGIKFNTSLRRLDLRGN